MEVGLALGCLLGATVVFMVGAWVGLVPTEGTLGTGIRMAAGPTITFLAVVGYRALAPAIDASQSELLGARVQEDALFPRMGAGRSVLVAVLGIAAAIAGSFVVGVALESLGIPPEEQESIVELVEAFHGGEVLPFVMLVVSATVLAPVAEETLFRGLVFRRIAARGHSLPEAFVLSAFAFATIHNNPAGFLIYVWLGLVFAQCYRRTGRLWVAMLVHAGNNAFALSLLVWG